MGRTLKLEVNLTAWTLFAIALGLRLYRLDHPNSVVFDELHYTKFVSLYIKGIFFFDTQPPLGKQLVAVTAYFAGFDGNSSSLNSIGSPYDSNTPVKALRILPVLSGSLVTLVIYGIVKSLHMSDKTAILTCLFYILENSFLTQSRFLLMDSMFIFFSMTGLLFTLKSREVEPLSLDWIVRLTAASIFISLGICIKFVAIYTLFSCVIIVLYDLWWLIPNKSIEAAKLWFMAAAYFVAYTVVPIFVYIFIFWIHLSWLTLTVIRVSLVGFYATSCPTFSSKELCFSIITFRPSCFNTFSWHPSWRSFRHG